MRTPPEISGLPETIEAKEGEPQHIPFEVRDEGQGQGESLSVYLQEAPPYCAVLWLNDGYVLEVSPGAAPPAPTSEEQTRAIRADEVRERIETRKNLEALLGEDISEEERVLVQEQLDALGGRFNRQLYDEPVGDAHHHGRVVVRASDQRDVTDFELIVKVTE